MASYLTVYRFGECTELYRVHHHLTTACCGDEEGEVVVVVGKQWKEKSGKNIDLRETNKFDASNSDANYNNNIRVSKDAESHYL